MTFVQQEFQRQFQSKPLTYPAIISLVKNFDVTGTVEDLPCPGQPVTAMMAKHQPFQGKGSLAFFFSMEQ